MLWIVQTALLAPEIRGLRPFGFGFGRGRIVVVLVVVIVVVVIALIQRRNRR